MNIYFSGNTIMGKSCHLCLEILAWHPLSAFFNSSRVLYKEAVAIQFSILSHQLAFRFIFPGICEQISSSQFLLQAASYIGWLFFLNSPREVYFLASLRQTSLKQRFSNCQETSQHFRNISKKL